MAEYKQYISQAQENGNVLISEDVVEAIAEHALAEVEGAAGLSVKPGNEVADFIGVRNWGKGLKIYISEDNTVSIDADIVIRYGYYEEIKRRDYDERKRQRAGCTSDLFQRVYRPGAGAGSCGAA